jgi:hypothetical protein
MIHHRRSSMTPVQTRLRRSRPISLREKTNLHSLVCLSCQTEVAWPLIRLPPFPPRVVGLPRYALPPSPACRAPSLPTPLTYVLLTCATHLRPSHLCRSLPLVYPSLIVVGRAANPAMAAGAHVSWRLRSSPTKSRAPTSVASAGGARMSRLATGSHPNDRSRPSPSLCCKCMFKCFKCFRGMLQLLHMDLAKVDRDVAHIVFFCKCFQWYLQAF